VDSNTQTDGRRLWLKECSDHRGAKILVPSLPAEFCEDDFDLLRHSEATFRRGTQPALDPGQLLGRRLINVVA
jgi:hypothetical protein